MSIKMVKVLFVIPIILGLFYSILLAEEKQSNIIVNGGFEEDGWDEENNLPAKGGYWAIERGNVFEVMERDSKVKKEGKSSLYIMDIHTGKTNEGIYFQLAGDRLKPYFGKTVSLTGWIKQISSKPAKQVGFKLAVQVEKWTQESCGTEIEGEEDWKQYSVSIKIPDDAKLFRVFIMCAWGWGSTGEAYFDDLMLTVVDDEKNPEGKKKLKK